MMLGRVPPHQQGQAPPPPLVLDSINDGDTIDITDAQPHHPNGHGSNNKGSTGAAAAASSASASSSASATSGLGQSPTGTQHLHRRLHPRSPSNAASSSNSSSSYGGYRRLSWGFAEDEAASAAAPPSASPLAGPLPRALCAADLLGSLLAFLPTRDRAALLASCAWLRAERVHVLRELDLRQPAPDGSGGGPRAAGGGDGKDEAARGPQHQQHRVAKGMDMDEAGGGPHEDGTGSLLASHRAPGRDAGVGGGGGGGAGGRDGLLVLGSGAGVGGEPWDEEARLAGACASLLHHTPLARRMRYRGDVRLLSRAILALSCPSPTRQQLPLAPPPLARLLALDLCECNLTPAAARALAAAIEARACPRLGHLDISDNPQLGEEGARAVGLALQRGALPMLQGLLLFGDRIGSGGGVAVAQAIAAGAIPQLQILDLSGNGLGTVAALELAKALEARQSPLIQQLGLSDNDIAEEGVEAVAAALGSRAAAGCARLEKLHLGGNAVGPRAARRLGEALRTDGCGARLALLELHSARLGGEGIRVVADVLRSGACGALKELWLDDNTEGEEDGVAVQDVMAVLAQGALPALEALGLNWTSLGSDGAAALAAALVAFPRPSLHRLDLRSTSITGPGLAPLTDALGARRSCPGLRWLDISGNALFLAGATELARALRAGAGKNLRRLDLHAVGLEAEGLREVAGALRDGACPQLIGLGLALNRLGPQGAVELAGAMAGGGLARLVGLELHKNELGDAGIEAVVGALAGDASKDGGGGGGCPLLLYLGLSANGAGDRGALALERGLRRGKGLARLERLNLQDNHVGERGLAALEAAAAAAAALAKGGRLRLEVGGNTKPAPGARGREAAGQWLRTVTQRALIGLVVGGGAVLGAVGVRLVLRAGLESAVARLLAAVGLAYCGFVVGLAQHLGLTRAWEGVAAGTGMVAAAAPAPAATGGIGPSAAPLPPLALALAVVAGDAAITAAGLGVGAGASATGEMGWFDVLLVFVWTQGITCAYALSRARANAAARRAAAAAAGVVEMVDVGVQAGGGDVHGDLEEE